MSKNSNFTAYSPPPSPGLGHDHDDMDSHAISGISAITDIDTKRMSVRSQASQRCSFARPGEDLIDDDDLDNVRE